MEYSKNDIDEYKSSSSSDVEEHMEFPKQILRHKEDLKKLGNELSKRIHKIKVYK